MIASARHWLATHGPFTLRTELYGPMTRQDKAVFCITSVLGIVVSLMVFGSAYIMGGN